MRKFEDFRSQLQSALAHLYDPAARFPITLYEAIGCDPASAPEAVQSALTRLIEGLALRAQGEPNSRLRREYDVLYLRFVLGLTQEEAASRLHISLRTLQRIQREAVHLLARQLWNRMHSGSPGPEEDVSAKTVMVASPDQRSGWLSQVRQELLSLQQSSHNVQCNLKEALSGALHIATTRSNASEAIVEFQPIQIPVHVRFHPSVLRQILLTLISGLIRAVGGGDGRITIHTQLMERHCRLMITARPLQKNAKPEFALIQELLLAYGGKLKTAQEGNAIALALDLPLIQAIKEKVTVLVIDDNVDLVTLYRSYCVGTPYSIENIRKSTQVSAALTALHPDLILLDVLLPDVNGWDLLLDLHANPTTRTIPIIVCSVVTDEQLALDLGAALYLRKPVWREQLLAAFEYALSTKFPPKAQQI
jgi:CheY-like chemotaxis protein